MTAVHVVPTQLEVNLAETLVEAMWRDPLPDVMRQVAEALAQHRARTHAQAIGYINTLAQQSEHITDEQLAAFKRGWTPQQVHGLVAAFAALKTDLHRVATMLGAK